MYGLLAAAEQIRQTGTLVAANGKPAVPIRGIRKFIHNRDLEADWYFSREYWTAYCQMLARNRFNRFNLVFAHQTNYMAPPYPFWVGVPQFPEIRATGVTEAQRKRNLEMLRFISQTAAEHGIDFTLGIWEHNIQNGMVATVEGLTERNIGPYSYAALRRVLAECPAIRSVQVRTNSESGIPPRQQVEFFRDHIFKAIREAGRLVTLDLRGWIMSGGMLEAAESAGVPLRLSTKFWAEHMGPPYQPAETFPHYSYMNFLRKPRSYEFLWEIWALGSNRLLLWGDPDHVRRALSTVTLSGTQGFEIDEPLAQKGFGNRPGKWGIFTPANADRVFWKYEFERYWLFYRLWGRLGFDPKTPARAWQDEFVRRFGKASNDALAAYQNASRILPEITAAHMPDPNMYVWPEINPGGLIDVYRQVLPSDWRFVAPIGDRPAAGSAKQSPAQTAERLRRLAVQTEEAVARARAALGPSHREWRGTEPDFRVLAALARYHAHKQLAAQSLTWFYETADRAALDRARSELQGALKVWSELVKLTDGLYPAEMAFGPSDWGHWADKLPYVRHDIEVLEERSSILNRFGRFDFGFDFGAAGEDAKGPRYRTLRFLLNSTLEPRFQLATATMLFDNARGYGWIAPDERQTHPLEPTPYEVLRANARKPGRFPENLLFGDSISGEGPQIFRVRTGPGEFMVSLVDREGNATTAPQQARDGVLDVAFPEGHWDVSGVVIKSVNPEQALPPRAEEPNRGPAPSFSHLPPRRAPAGAPLTLSLKMTPAPADAQVRLHYRPLDQLAEFKTLEAPAARPVFTIPGEDVAGQFDLLYYFEALTPDSGWFYPDPAVVTPYFVVETQAAPDAPSGR
ncbi:MAG: hypothetical protein KIT09_27395 [Bryobacteraceae bacterium]|nr:hypothetical protein [Bryobacteraceae bacterium]